MTTSRKSISQSIGKDPKVEFKKGTLIAIIMFSLGIGQLALVVGTRSELVWRYQPGPLSGETTVSFPRTYLLPDRYVIMVVGYFPHILDGNVTGNMTLIHQSSGTTYTFNYEIEGYLMYEKLIYETRSWVMEPGNYNITWNNNVDRFEYFITTHGLFNFFPQNDKYPYVMESVMLVISVFGLIALLIGAIKKYQRSKRAFSYHE
ncbi:MAG: hypothetical protein ACFFFB_12880 [Candidatus Heimdallarchaeota archaeon]